MLLPEPVEFVGKWEFPVDESEHVPDTLRIDKNGETALSLLRNKRPPTPSTGRISQCTTRLLIKDRLIPIARR